MSLPTSKELYIMNGGNKLYIWKDGYQDIYNATAGEEAAWDKEIIAAAIEQLDTQTNTVSLQFAVNTLLYHKQPGLEKLLKERLRDKNPVRQIAFANALWNISKNINCYETIMQHLSTENNQYPDEVFAALNDFKDCKPAQDFLVHCLEQHIPALAKKAKTVIAMWAYSGIPELRDDELTANIISPNAAIRKAAIAGLRKIFETKNRKRR